MLCVLGSLCASFVLCILREWRGCVVCILSIMCMFCATVL